MFGLGFVGPVGHFWYEGLDKFIKLKLRYVPKSTRFVAAKVAMDGLIFGPIDLLVFFTYMGYATGKNTSQVKEGIKRDFLPALALEGGAWPLLQIANFRYVPVQYQLLYVNVFCLIDSAFLSWVEQQKDAAWKQWFTTFLTLKERGGTGGAMQRANEACDRIQRRVTKFFSFSDFSAKELAQILRIKINSQGEDTRFSGF